MELKSAGREIGAYIVAAFVIAGIFWTLMKLFAGPLPADNENMLNLVTGFLIAKGGTIVDYYFGSSKGSAEKSETLTSLNNSEEKRE